MKQFNFLIACLLAVMLAACTSQEPEFEFTVSPLVDQMTSEYAIPIDDALLQADNVLNKISPNTRVARKIKSIRKIGKHELESDMALTRSIHENDTTMFYLVNYEDEQGFAMLSADKRLPAILAISDESNLEIEDTITNPALKVFFNQMNQLAIGVQPHPQDSLPLNASDIIVETIYEPKLSKEVSLWGQEYPYNIYISPFTFEDNTYDKVGSKVIALAQIFSYFKQPKYLGEINNDINLKFTPINWTTINSLRVSRNPLVAYPRDNGNLFQMLQLVQEWYTEELFMYFEGIHIVDFMKSLGYQAPFYPDPCDGKIYPELGNDGCYKRLDDGCLIYAGVHDGNTFDDTFVIDGYNKLKYLNSQPTIKNMYFIYHCVWGKYGRNNGYFMIYDDPNKKISGVDFDNSFINDHCANFQYYYFKLQ